MSQKVIFIFIIKYKLLEPLDFFVGGPVFSFNLLKRPKMLTNAKLP